MESLYTLFGGNKDINSEKEVKVPSSSILTTKKEDVREKYDTKSVEYFKSQNLNRNNFTYEILSNINWWPDEIVVFLEILRISYSAFINTYMSIANTYDLAIKNAIFFMNQKKYNKLNEIKKYLANGNYTIPDNYLNVVINEDNCYMYEIEERNRSQNEQKHYLLTKALTKLMENTPISEGEFIFTKEYENLTKTYLCIYHLKNAYAIVDDTLRIIMKATFEGNVLGINLNTYFKDMLDDIDAKIGKYIKDINDMELSNKVYIFKDLLLYGLYSTTQFNYVFNFKRNYDLYDKIDIYKLSPFISSFKKSEAVIPILVQKEMEISKLFTEETVSRIQYIFKYYLNIIVDNNSKSNLIKQSNDFDMLYNKLEETKSRPRLLTPRYLERRFNTDNKGMLDGTFIMTPEGGGPVEVNETRSNKHTRKISIDTLISPRKISKPSFKVKK